MEEYGGMILAASATIGIISVIAAMIERNGLLWQFLYIWGQRIV